MGPHPALATLETTRPESRARSIAAAQPATLVITVQYWAQNTLTQNTLATHNIHIILILSSVAGENSVLFHTSSCLANNVLSSDQMHLYTFIHL